MIVSGLGLGLVAASGGAGLAQAPALASVCTGLGVGFPTLTTLGSVASGVLGGVLDPALNGVVGGVDANVVNVLSGRTLGVGVLDGSGHLATVGPGACNVSASSFAVEDQRGVALGGGRLTGLGGIGNAGASAGAADAVAIGNGATTGPGVAGAVAVGAGAVALRPGLSGAAEAYSGAAVTSTAGAVSIGAPGAERQLTNLAGGTAPTDAVNLRQLRAVGANLAAGLGGGAGFDPVTGTYAGPAYAIRGTVYGDVGTALSALDRGLASGLVQQDPATRAITVGAATGGRALSVAGTDGDRRVGGVADGIAANDAATVGQVARAELRLATLVDAVPVRVNNALARPAPSAGGADALAIGAGAAASGVGATALGNGAAAGGERSLALGNGARADASGSVALGAGAVATRADQVAVGGARSTYTLAGLASAESAAAQSGPTRFVTTDAGGNLATSAYGPASIAALDGRLGSAETRLGQAEARIAGVARLATEGRREARQGVAGAMAMTSAAMPSAPGRTAWVANTATFRGEWGAGGAVAHRLDTAVPLAVTAGYAYGGGTSHGVRVGLGGEF